MLQVLTRVNASSSVRQGPLLSQHAFVVVLFFFFFVKVPGVRYVPMVGKVTVAMLERNVLRLHENFGEGTFTVGIYC